MVSTTTTAVPEERATLALRRKMRTELAFAWCGLALIVVAGIGLFGGGLFPPLSPRASGHALRAFYGDHRTLLRMGLIVTVIGFGFFGPFVVSVSSQMRRIEGASPLLATGQLVAGAAGWVFLTIPMFIFSAAAYRATRSTDTLSAINDLGWFTFVMPIFPFMPQVLFIAIAVFQDTNEQPLLPRWYGYLNVWVFFLFFSGGLLTFFKSGPFDWRGLMALYVPLSIFGVWLIASSWLFDRAIRRHYETAHGLTA